MKMGWWIALGVLLLLALLLSLPLWCDVRWTGKEYRVILGYGPFSLDRKGPEKPQRPPQKEDKPKPPKKKKKSGPLEKLFQTQEPVDLLLEACDLLSDALSRLTHLLRRVTVTRFRLDGRIAAGDAAETAIRYGQVCGAVYPLRGLLHGLVRFREDHVSLCPDFQGETSAATLSLRFRVGLFPVLCTLFQLGLRLLRAYLRLSAPPPKRPDAVS